MKHQKKINAEKRIRDIKGFYMHAIASCIILPFLMFINLQLVPQFRWFWFAFIAWFIGVLIHWINVFKLSNNWETKKINQIIGKHHFENENAESHIQEQYFLKAKKQAKEIKGFYIHLSISMLAAITIVIVNLKFVPSFHFFWFAVSGIFIAVFLHWLAVFGLDFFGLGKNWEERKLKELINK